MKKSTITKIIFLNIFFPLLMFNGKGQTDYKAAKQQLDVVENNLFAKQTQLTSSEVKELKQILSQKLENKNYKQLVVQLSQSKEKTNSESAKLEQDSSDPILKTLKSSNCDAKKRKIMHQKLNLKKQ